MSDSLAPDQVDSAGLADQMMNELTGNAPAAPAPPSPSVGDGKDAAAPGGQPADGKDPKTGDGKPAGAPAAPKASPQAPKPSDPKPQTPPQSGKASPKPADAPDSDDDKVKDPVELRKRLKAIRQEYSGFKLTKAQEEEKLKKELEAYKGKKYLTPEQEAEYEKTTKRQAELERELYGQNFRKSPEFKKQYQDKIDSLWTDAVEEVSGIPILYTEKNGEGEDVQKSRPAEARDLKAVLDAPPAERFNVAQKLFGSARDMVLSHVRDIVAVQKAAHAAIEEKRKAYEAEVQSQTAAQQKESQDYARFMEEHSETLIRKRPDIYAPDESNPKATEALERGKKFVNETLANASTMDVSTRAARFSLMQLMASALPRVVVERDALKAEKEELLKELEKYRHSDPGAGGDGGGDGGGAGGDGGGGDAEPKGSDELATMVGATE